MKVFGAGRCCVILAEGREEAYGECFAFFGEHALGEAFRVPVQGGKACLRFSACKGLTCFVEESSFDSE